MTNARRLTHSSFNYHGIVRPKTREAVFPITEKWAGVILGILLGSALLYSQTHPKYYSVTADEKGSVATVADTERQAQGSRAASLQDNSRQGVSLQHQAEPELSPEGTALVAHLVGSGVFMLQGKLNGQDLAMLIDTGSTWVTIPGAIARQMNLQKGEAVTVRTSAGEATHYFTQIDRLELGNHLLKGVTALIAPELDGEVILGMNLLSGFKLEKSQNGDSLRVEIDSHTPAELKSIPHFNKPVAECMKSGNQFDDYVLACLQNQI